MRKLKFIFFLTGIMFVSVLSCEKNEETGYFVGQIVEISCGGIIVQFQSDKVIGEEWNNIFSAPVLNYTNCVLVGNLSSDDFKKGDTIHFDYKKVEIFTNGNYCDIGGLPKTKIEITKLYPNI